MLYHALEDTNGAPQLLASWSWSWNILKGPDTTVEGRTNRFLLTGKYAIWLPSWST
jgi:hypothetical protein